MVIYVLLSQQTLTNYVKAHSPKLVNVNLSWQQSELELVTQLEFADVNSWLIHNHGRAAVPEMGRTLIRTSTECAFGEFYVPKYVLVVHRVSDGILRVSAMAINTRRIWLSRRMELQ